MVLIVRGGGGDVGLHCYNHVKLAQAVAQFPIPVITGVGHSTNLTVTEMVAHSNQITPTAVANFILSHFDAVYQQLIHALEAIPRQMNWVLSREKSRLTQGILYLQKEVKKPVNTALLDLKSMESRLQIGSGKHLNNAHQFIHKLLPKQLQISTGNRIKQHQTHVQHLQEKLGLIDPNNVLKRGYSLTLKSNKVISESNPVQPGDIIITKNAHQQIQSTVTTIKPHE